MEPSPSFQSPRPVWLNSLLQTIAGKATRLKYVWTGNTTPHATSLGMFIHIPLPLAVSDSKKKNQHLMDVNFGWMLLGK